MTEAPNHIPVCVICGQEYCDHSEDQQLAHMIAVNAGQEPPVFASDPPDPKLKKRKQGQENREVSDIEWMMSHANGRRLMWGLISRCQLFNNSYLSSRGEASPLAHMSFLEGARNVGNEYFALVTKHCQSDYFKMLEENKS